MIQKRKQYSKQFKVDAVKLVTEQDYKVTEAARNLGIHHSSLRRWKNQFETNGNQAFPGKGNLSPEKEELYRLRKENKRLRIELEILKKAAAFFVKESNNFGVTSCIVNKLQVFNPQIRIFLHCGSHGT